MSGAPITAAASSTSARHEPGTRHASGGQGAKVQSAKCKVPRSDRGDGSLTPVDVHG
jgi:hypothetical protein